MPQLRDTLHQMNQGHYSQGNLRSKQRNGSASVLCADGAGSYVSAQSEDFEGTEVLLLPGRYGTGSPRLLRSRKCRVFCRDLRVVGYRFKVRTGLSCGGAIVLVVR